MRIFPFGRKQSGFTLVELMIVVAVIAVLTALLLPALRLGRELARETVCMSGLRQIGMASTAYSADNRGYIVPTGADPAKLSAEWNQAPFNGKDTIWIPGVAWGVWWHWLLSDYTDNKDSSEIAQDSAPIPGESATDQIVRNRGRGITWACPTAKSDRNLDPGAGNVGWTGYGKNFNALMEPTSGVTGPDCPYDSWWHASGSMAWYKEVRAARVTNPSRRIMVGDSRNSVLWFWATQTVLSFPSKNEMVNANAPDRHRGKANYLFFDGHVQRLGGSRTVSAHEFRKGLVGLLE